MTTNQNWRTCSHKWGKWEYAAGYGDENHWRHCTKCRAEQTGMRAIVVDASKSILAPRK